MNETIRILEALLFASTEPMSAQALHDRMPEDADVGAGLMELQKHYEERGVNLMNIDGLWAFRTASDLADVLVMEKQETKKQKVIQENPKIQQKPHYMPYSQAKNNGTRLLFRK